MICGKQEIGEKPTIEQLTIRIWQKKLNVSSIKMFEHYENKKWKNKDGMPLKDIDPAIGRFNQFVYFKRKTGDLRKEYDILLKTNEWKEYAKTVHQHYHNECQRCHKKGSLVLNNIMGPFIAIAAAGLTFFAFWVLSAYLIHHCFISPKMVM